MDVLLKMASQMEALEKKIGDGDVADDENDAVDEAHEELLCSGLPSPDGSPLRGERESLPSIAGGRWLPGSV
jgi:hypothetical protein